MSGYTRIPNIILESMFTEMNATEQAMCAYLCRHTYGMKNKKSFEATKSKMVKDGVGSKGSIDRNWESEIVGKFFGRDGSKWVSKVSISSKDDGIKSIQQMDQKYPTDGSKVSKESTKSIQTTSGVKKKKENIKENIKENDRPLADVFFSSPEKKQPHHKFSKMQIIQEFTGHELHIEKIWKITKWFMDYCKTPNWGTFQSDLWDVRELIDIWPSEEKLNSFVVDYTRANQRKPWPSQVIDEIRSWSQPKLEDRLGDSVEIMAKWLSDRSQPLSKLPEHLQEIYRQNPVSRGGLSKFEIPKLAKSMINQGVPAHD